MSAEATSLKKINLLDLDRSALQLFFEKMGEASYRSTQVMKWIHHQGVNDVDAMTNLSKSLRAYLKENTVIEAPHISKESISEDGTRKWLMQLHDGNAIETVFIPEESRGTLCVSSQVGCALNCTFCATAQQGFSRNLSVSEIIGQVWQAARRLSQENGAHDHAITNIVMMGMGEPLLNFDAVVSAMSIMMDDFAYGLSKRRVTLSTSGIVPAMLKLAEVSDVALAVSLHAPNDALRNVLVPINKKYPIQSLMDVCKNYFKNDPRRYVTIEYVMLDRINDTPAHAKELALLLKNAAVKVNLIPFNPFSLSQYRRSSQENIDQFRDILIDAGINTITRKTRGDDIDAACGQLVGKVFDRTRRSAKMKTGEPVYE